MHRMSESDDDSQKMFGNYGNESKIKTSGGDEPYSPSAPTDPTDTWSPKGLAKHMSAYSDIFEDPEMDPTEGSSSGSGGARPKTILKPRSTSMSDNRSPPHGSSAKRKTDDLSDSESYDNDDGHLQEDSDGDSDSSDGAPSIATCAICLGKMRGEVGSPNVCEHTFCLECILEWSNNNATCPQDRKPFNHILVRHYLGGAITSELPVELPQELPQAVEENPTYCEVCNECDREDRLLLCDGCDLGYHLECLTPPLNTVPIEEWFCPACVTADLPHSVPSSRWEQSSEAGPSSSSTGSRVSRYSQSQSRFSHRDNRGAGRQRLVPRTLAVERVRIKIAKNKASKRKEKKRRKKERNKKVKSAEHDKKLHHYGKESEGADVDAQYNSDDDAEKILAGNALQKRYSSHHAKERQEEKKNNAAKIVFNNFFTPRTSYAGPKTSVVTRVALAPQPASADILGDIFESQAIAFGSSKNLTLTEDRKLQPKDPKKIEDDSVAKDIPLPSSKSSTSTKEDNHSPSRSSKSKYNSSPRSSKRSPSPRNSRRSPSPRSSKRSLSPKNLKRSPSRNSKRSPSPRISKRSPSKSSKRSPSPRSSKRSLSPRNSKRSPSPKSSRRSPSPKNSKRSPSPRTLKQSSSPKRRSKLSPPPKHSKRSPSPRISKRSSSPRSSRRSPSSRNYKRTPSPRGYKKRSPSPKVRRSSQDNRREYSSRTDRSQEDKYYSPLESRKRSPPKMSYGRPVSNKRERERKRSFSPDKQDTRKSKHYSPRSKVSKESISPETLYFDPPERKDKPRDNYKDSHKGDKGYDQRDRSPQRKDKSPYREKSPHRKEYSPIREKSPQKKEMSPRRRELSLRRDSSPFRSRKTARHMSGSHERGHSREKNKVKERSQWSHSYFSSNGTEVTKLNSGSYSVHSVHSVQSSSKSHKGEISKRDSSQDSSDDKSKTSPSSSKESSSSDSSSESSSTESEKDSEEEASEQLSLHSVGNLMMALKNKKKGNDKRKDTDKKPKKEKVSKIKKKKISSQNKEIEIDSDSSRKAKKNKKNKRKSVEETFVISDETEEDEQPIQTINKLKVEPRTLKHKSSSKDIEIKRKKHSKNRHKSASSSSSSNSSESDSSDSDSDKEKSESKFKNIETQKIKENITEDVGGSSSIGDKKISISLKDNFSIRINKKNALGIEEEPTKKMSGLPLPVKEAVENKYDYFNPYEKKRVSHYNPQEENPYEKKRVSHYNPQEEKPKLLDTEKKSVSSLFERTSLVKTVVNKEKGKEKSLKSFDKNKSIPTIPLPDEKLVREEAIRNDVIKDLIEENHIIKDALMQGSESQRDVIKDAIKDVMGSSKEKALIRIRSDIVRNTDVNNVKKANQTWDKIKSIPTIPLPADKPKKPKQDSDDEIEEVWRKAIPGSSRRRSGEIKLNLLTDKARNNDKSKRLFEKIEDDDIIGLQITKKKEESQDLLNKMKKQTSDEEKNKDKNEIKKIHETNKDKIIHKSENKEKEKSQSHRDSSNKSDIKILKETPKKAPSDLYTEKKSVIPGLDLISPKKRDPLDIELPTERKRTFSLSSSDDDDYDFNPASFDINKIINSEIGKTKEDKDLLKRQKREMEKERKVAECLKAFHRHKGILDSEDELEDKDSSLDVILDKKTQKDTETIEKRRSSTHGLVDSFVLQNNPDLKDNSEDDDKPYSPTQEKPYSPTQEKPYSPTQEKPYSPTQDKLYSPMQDKPYSPTQSYHLDSDPEGGESPYSPTQHVPDEEMPVPKPSSPAPPNKRLQNPVSGDLLNLTGAAKQHQLNINKGLLESKVIEEVKKYLDPYYRDKTFNREQYKQIVSKCVDKVVNVECGYVVESHKMQKLVDGYVKLFKHRIKKDRSLKL